MTVDRQFLTAVERYLDDRAGDLTVAYLDAALTRTAEVRQRPWWSSPERWLPMDFTLRPTPFLLRAPRRTIWILAVLALLILTLVVVLAGSGRSRLPAPFGLAANGTILVETTSVSNGDILIADADGSDLRALIGGETNDFGATYTRDGTRIVFLRRVGPGLIQPMIATDAGQEIRALTARPLEGLDWYEPSPTGDRIVFVHTVDRRRVLSVVRTDDPSTLEQLAIQGDLQVDPVALWRPPDGEELIFRARPTIGRDEGVGIYAIRADGTGFRALSVGKGGAPPYDMMEASPDGRELTYWQYDADRSPNGATANVHLLDLDTAEDRIIRFGDDPTLDEAELHFAPAGNRAVIVSCPAGECRLAIVTRDHSEPPSFVGPEIPGPQMGRSHGFSPDGTVLVLHVDNVPPTFIDVESGAVTTADAPFGVFGSWQRQALP